MFPTDGTFHGNSFPAAWECKSSYASNMFTDIQTSRELIQMDTKKMMTYELFTMDDEKFTVRIEHSRIGSLDKNSINQTFLISFIHLSVSVII